MLTNSEAYRKALSEAAHKASLEGNVPLVMELKAQMVARVGTCGCECCHGGFCGGCGHAGCGGRS